MTCLKLEVGYPSCSALCQHPSCWPSFSPAPSNRGLQHPRMRRLLQAQSLRGEAAEQDASSRILSSELPTLKILDIGHLANVGNMAPPSPSPTHIFPAVSSSRKATRTATHTRSSRSRSNASVLIMPESPPPKRTPAPPRPEPTLRTLPVRLNYVTVHDPSNPIPSTPSKPLTWQPPSPEKPTRAKQQQQPLQNSQLKNVTSQLIPEGFEDEGDVISAYSKTCAFPALRPCWLSWEGAELSLPVFQPDLTADELASRGSLLSSRSNTSFLSNRELFLSGRGLWRPRRNSKRASGQSRALPAAATSSLPPNNLTQQEPPHLSQISISLDSIPYIPKRVPVVLERFLSHPSPSKLPLQIKAPYLSEEPFFPEDNQHLHPMPETVLLSAPPPTPDCSQDRISLSQRLSLRVHLPTSPPPLQLSEP